MRATAAAVALLTAGVACDSSSMTTADSVAPAIAVAMSSHDLEVARGQVELILANVTRAGGTIADDVVMVVDSAPAGIRAQVSGYVTENGVTSAYVAVFVDPAVVIGTYNLAVRAMAFGLPDVSTPLSVIVEPAGTPAFTLESRPISVVRGNSTVVYANIDRGSNTRDIPITVSAENLPLGVKVSLYPVTNYKALANMTVTVAADVSPGLHWVTIRGVAALMTDRVATIPLQVLAN